MGAFDRIVIIYNPQSTGDGPALARELAEQCRIDPGLPVELIETMHAGHAVDLARKAAISGSPLIVSVSGDGGYNEVVNGIMATGNPDATATVLSAGNANDHARVVQNEPLIDLIRRGQTTRIDLLEMTIVDESGDSQSRYAHSYIGFGITPTVAVELEKGGKGAWREILTTLQTLQKFQPFKVEFADGGQAEVDSILCANIDQMAKVAKLSDDGQPDDGVFEVIALPHDSSLGVVATAVKAAIVGLGVQPSVRSYEFRTLRPMPAQLDGEVWELAKPCRVVIRCRAHALRTLG